MAEDDLLPDVRVGMAVGPVLSRLGDVFGTTVNRASRLTSVAPAGGVLVDDALAAALAALSGFETTALRRRTLRGIGPVTPSELRRATGGRQTSAQAISTRAGGARAGATPAGATPTGSTPAPRKASS
jgi:adenylate cyclase